MAGCACLGGVMQELHIAGEHETRMSIRMYHELVKIRVEAQNTNKWLMFISSVLVGILIAVVQG